jgi:hypothetical protein
MKAIYVILIILMLVSGAVLADKVSKIQKVDDKILVNGFDAASKNGKVANGVIGSYSVDTEEKQVVFHTWANNLGDKKQGVKTYIKDTETDELKLIKEDARFPAISPDGKYVVYEWSKDYETSLPGMYLYNIKTGSETFVDYTSGGNLDGWKSQVFEWVDDTTVKYQTSYGGNGWLNKTYIVGEAK